MESEKIVYNKDFKRLYGRGSSYVHRCLVTYVIKNRSGKIRFGITTGKKIGPAVLRNRARRVITAAMRECLPAIDCSGGDIVFVARTRTPYSKSNEIAEVILKHLTEAGLVPEDKNETDIQAVD